MSEKIKGRITEILPDGKYRVELEPERVVMCYVAGKMIHNGIRVVLGDWVDVQLDPYGGKATNRIVRRL